jgi:hypothetical protein
MVKGGRRILKHLGQLASVVVLPETPKKLSWSPRMHEAPTSDSQTPRRFMGSSVVERALTTTSEFCNHGKIFIKAFAEYLNKGSDNKFLT